MNAPFRTIITYGDHFAKFMEKLSPKEREKVNYVLSMLETEKTLSARFVKHIKGGLYELRAQCDGNAYRIFFTFDDNRVVVLFCGFQKKTQKTPAREIEKATDLMNEYYGEKRLFYEQSKNK